MSRARVILHVDMDAFYASVEQRDNPELKGKPVLVGGSSGRGVVTTASYEAREFGCTSAMPMSRALRLCPRAVVVKPRIGHYAAISRQVRAILERYSPDLEPVSIDEAFVELTNVPTWSGRALDAARAIKRAIRDGLSLSASVGVASNKFLAKVGSDLNKPDGLSEIRDDQAARLLATMPVSVLLGVGPVVRERLRAIGIERVRDLLAADPAMLGTRFSHEQIHAWQRLGRGEDDRPVRTRRVAKSIGKERTFAENIDDPVALRAMMLEELEQADRSLREDGLCCRRVALKLRFADFTTFARSRTLADSTDLTPELRTAADALLSAFFAEHMGRATALRLIGVRLEDLSAAAEQPGLFDQLNAQRTDHRIDTLTDRIAERFGDRAIGRASSLTKARELTRRSGPASSAGAGESALHPPSRPRAS